MKRLMQHIVWAKRNLERVEPDYAIVWNRHDGGTTVTVPAPEWMAMALHGGLLPTVDVYHSLRAEWTHGETGEKIHTLVNDNPGPEWKHGRVINGHLLHEGPWQPAMTQEEAMEYLLQKDVPRYVWHDHDRSNSRQFVICPRSCIPRHRVWRNVWGLNQELQQEAA